MTNSQGNASTKTRAEVRGAVANPGGKGTGRALHKPLWRGGGVILARSRETRSR